MGSQTGCVPAPPVFFTAPNVFARGSGLHSPPGSPCQWEAGPRGVLLSPKRPCLKLRRHRSRTGGMSLYIYRCRNTRFVPALASASQGDAPARRRCSFRRADVCNGVHSYWNTYGIRAAYIVWCLSYRRRRKRLSKLFVYPSSTLETCRREVVSIRVAHETPMRIVFDTRKSDIRGCWHVGQIEPQSNVPQRGALNLMQGASVS